MTNQPSLTEQGVPRLAVIVSDFAAAYHMGASVETRVRVFDLPPEIAEFIVRNRKGERTVTLAIEDLSP